MKDSELIGKAIAFESVCICLRACDPSLADMLAKIVLREGLPDLPSDATEEDIKAINAGWQSSLLGLIKQH